MWFEDAMAVLRIDAARDGALSGGDWRDRLSVALEQHPGSSAPLCVMVHGYRYTWASHEAMLCPHSRLYGFTPRPCRGPRPLDAAWPGQLGFSPANPEEGLTIAFGWEARSLKSGGRARSFAQIYRDAETTAAALAAVISEIHHRRSDLEIDLFAHSLGARVVLSAMRQVPEAPFGRVILMAAAEYAQAARSAMAATSRGDVYHILSRANDPFDRMFRLLAPWPRPEQPATLAEAGLGARHQRWLDLQLDLPELAGWMAARGFRLEKDDPLSHWHFYTDPGAMRFYRTILRQRASHGIGALLADGLPDWIEPRWSRLRRGVSGLLGGGGPSRPTAGAALPNRG